MSTRENIERFLACRRIAVAGAPRGEHEFGRMLFRELRRRGYDAVPVNPAAVEMDGAPCYPRVQDIEGPVEAVLVMTAATRSAEVARDCVAKGAGMVWLYRAAGSGAVSGEAVEILKGAGIPCIEGHCPYMFLPNAGFPHNLHGAIARLVGAYPRP